MSGSSGSSLAAQGHRSHVPGFQAVPVAPVFHTPSLCPFRFLLSLTLTASGLWQALALLPDLWAQTGDIQATRSAGCVLVSVRKALRTQHPRPVGP